MKKTKKEIFDNHVWKAWSKLDNYDSLKFKVDRARCIMSGQHESFRNMTALRQFEYCVTICCIAIQTSTKDLRQFSISGDKKEVFKYSLNEGETEPEIFEIGLKRKSLI